VVVGKLLEAKEYGYGYDAQTGKYGDLVALGIIDPTKVVRTALAGLISPPRRRSPNIRRRKLRRSPRAAAWAAWITKENSVTRSAPRTWCQRTNAIRACDSPWLHHGCRAQLPSGRVIFRECAPLILFSLYVAACYGLFLAKRLRFAIRARGGSAA